MLLRYGEGRKTGRIIIRVDVKTGPLHVKAKFLLTMYIIDQEHYRHVILRDQSISVYGDAIIYHYDVTTPTLDTLMRLAWDDRTLHIGSYLEELIYDSNAIDEDLRSPDPSLYNERLVVREIDPQDNRPDVVFYIDNRRKIGHRSLIEHHSPYLRDAMNQVINYMRSKPIHVDITRQAYTIGLTPVLFRSIFDYMYGTKSILELHTQAFELLPLASTLGMSSFKQGLEYYIHDGMNENNIVEVLLLFQQCECEFLRPRAVAYAKKRLAAIAVSERFEELCNDPMLMRELCSGNQP